MKTGNPNMKTPKIIRAIFLISGFLLLIFGCSKKETPAVPTPPPVATVLQITLTDSVGNPWPGAKVALYATKMDFYNEVNAVDSTKVSDINGQVTFYGLDSIQYCWLANSGC